MFCDFFVTGFEGYCMGLGFRCLPALKFGADEVVQWACYGTVMKFYDVFVGFLVALWVAAPCWGA